MGKTDVTIQTFETLPVVDYKLVEQGFKKVAFFLSESHYFTTFNKKDIKEKRYNDLINNTLIVKTFYDDITKTQSSYMLHKHKYFNMFNNVVEEERLTSKIDSANEIIYMLQTAGLFNWVNLQQTKYIYTKKNVTLILSKVEGLNGLFIKLEEPSELMGMPRSKKFKILSKYIDNLNISHTPDYSCVKSLLFYNSIKKRKLV